ncbi:MAG: glycosyltransferase family 4 protein [Alphaproteobacteria bacterium]
MPAQAASGSTMAQPNPAIRGTRAGTYAIVVPWPPEARGGVNQVVINLYKEIGRTGPYTPLLFIPDWHTPRLREREVAGCRTVLMRMRTPYGGRISVPVLWFLKYLLLMPVSFFRLRRLIARYRIEAVNGQFPSLDLVNFAVLALFGLYRGRLFLTFQGRDIHGVVATRGFERRLWRWLLRRADAVVFCSDGLAKNLAKIDPGLRSVTVRNSISVDDLIEERQSAVAGRLPPGPFILNVAAFEHKKGQDVLIRAFARLAPDFPDTHLLLLGQPGPVYQELLSLAAALGLERRVHFMVNVPHAEILAYLDEATVFALPSRAEGLPIALLEAGVFGVPAVASRADGIPEVINSDDVGVLVDADDEPGLERALRTLLADADLRRALGQRLQKRVRDEFTWRRAWQEYLALMPNDRPSSERESSRAPLKTFRL